MRFAVAHFLPLTIALAANWAAWGAEHHGVVKFGGLPVPGATVTATQGDKRFSGITSHEGRRVLIPYRHDPGNPIAFGTANAPPSLAQSSARAQTAQPSPSAAGVGKASSPLIVGSAKAQTNRLAAARPVFDVASIRPSDPNERGGWVRFLPGRLQVINSSLIFVIQQVYGVRDYQIVGSPKLIADWKTARFNIEAKVEGATSEDELRLMAKNLLEDRFQLKIHRETREMPVYVLVQDKKGIRVKATPDNGRPRGSGGIESVETGWIQGDNIRMDYFVQTLSRRTDRPILDRTNYTEPFTFKLQWAPDVSSGVGVSGGDARPDEARPSLFAAVQEQMGLKLSPEKAPVEVLAIDHVEKPSEN